MKAIEEAANDSAQGWICVEDELPANSDDEQQILYTKESGVEGVAFYYRNNRFWSRSFCEIKGVKFWRYADF